MGHTRRVAAAMSAGLLLLTACANNDGNDDPAPIGGENEADPGDADTTDEEEDEPYAVPDEIDKDYAEDVINALLEIDVEALQVALQQDSGENLDFEAADRVHAISEGRRRSTFMETLQRYADDAEPPEALRPADEMEATRFEAELVIHAEPSHCLIVAGWWDLTNTTVEPPDRDEKSLFSLSRIDRNVTSFERNPTPWTIRHISGLIDEDGKPIPEEDWADLNFGNALDHTCEDR